MPPIAIIGDSFVLYRAPLILSLSAAAGVCFFMACCSFQKIPPYKASAAVLISLILSLLFSRLLYWYGRPDSYTTLFHALSASSHDAYALPGVIAGCGLAALLIGRNCHWKKFADCFCVAGCWSMALGRLSCFFTEADRGQVMAGLTGLPWAFPVTNISGYTEYRFATFLFQAAFAAVLGIFLAVIFIRRRSRQGDVTILFFLFYCASQIILDSTRYDSLYLRSNGFVSIEQILSAIGLISVMGLLMIRTLKNLGFQYWMLSLWIILPVLFGGTGYMEYYVQRHGREAAFAYSIMGACLICIAVIGMVLWSLAHNSKAK